MTDAVIVDIIRTPGGKRNGQLRDWHPASLAAYVLNALIQRNALDPALVDDVIMGCVSQINEQASNIARNAILGAGWPESVPGTTVDRQCGSSQQAVHFAAQGVMSGAYDIVVAAGVESMTRVPIGSSWSEVSSPWPPEALSRYSETGLPHQGIGAEMIADEYGLSRFDLDEFSAQSQQRAAVATSEGRFEKEIVPVPVDLGDGVEDQQVVFVELGDGGSLVSKDEGIREGTTTETLGVLKSAFKEHGKVTAGNSSQICDGASAALIMSAKKAA